MAPSNGCAASRPVAPNAFELDVTQCEATKAPAPLGGDNSDACNDERKERGVPVVPAEKEMAQTSPALPAIA